MTKKQIVTLLTLVILLVIVLTACIDNDSRAEKEADLPQSTEQLQDVTLEVLNPKVEISSQFEQMANEYMSENPHVRINIRTVGGGAEDRDELRAMFAAGQGPDVFTNGGYEEAHLYRNYLEDLSDQPWVQRAIDKTLEPMTMDGKIFGMPVNIEGYGFIYNKDLFVQAGILKLPKTLTELLGAVKKLQLAGITPFANAYAEKWILAVHLLNIGFAHQEDPDAFIRGLNNGTQSIQENPQFLDLIKLLDLTIVYGNDKPLTIDYNTQVTEFAKGRAAIIQQGNWIQPMLDQITPNMNIGMLPIPINDDPRNDALLVGIPNNWVINKMSSEEKKAEAKQFLNWMVSSEIGKTYLNKKFKFIPAFHNLPSDNLGPLADDILSYIDENKTLTWNWFKYPDVVSDYDFGPAFQAYIGKQLNVNQLLQEIQKSWDEAIEK